MAISARSRRPLPGGAIVSDDWGLGDDFDEPWTVTAPSHLVDVAERQRLNRWFTALLDETDPGWRERRRLAQSEADMLWRNQRITYLSQDWRDMLAAIPATFRAMVAL